MLIDKNEYGVIDIGTGISNKLVDIMNQCKMTYTGTIGLEIERKDNKADISNLTKYGWKPKINLYQYLDKEIERRIN
jgi:nucleoside-diphosphate-sugar epimerase